MYLGRAEKRIHQWLFNNYNKKSITQVQRYFTTHTIFFALANKNIANQNNKIYFPDKSKYSNSP